MHAELAIVGWETHPGSGAAYVFDWASGALLSELIADDAAPAMRLGTAVAIHGGIALVGAPNDDVDASNSGSAYLFDAASGVQLAKLVPPVGAVHANFGGSVAFDGSTAIVGAVFDLVNGVAAGSVYVFDVSSGQLLWNLVPANGLHLGFFAPASRYPGRSRPSVHPATVSRPGESSTCSI